MRLSVDGWPVDVAEFRCTLFRLSAAVAKRFPPGELFAPNRPKEYALRGLYARDFSGFTDNTLDVCGAAFASECSDLIHLDQVFVKPEWRGRRLGLYAMRALAGAFAFDSSALLVYQPWPSQCLPDNELLLDGARRFEQYQLDKFDHRAARGTARLREYFAATGFKQVPGTTCWVHDLGFCLPPWDSLSASPKSPAAE